MPLEAVPRHQLEWVPDDMKSEPDHEQNPQMRILLDCQKVCDTFGGLAQYLNGRITSSEAQASFESLLRNLLPSSDLVDYWRPGDSVHNGQMIRVRLAILGFVPSASTKPAPYPKTFLA